MKIVRSVAVGVMLAAMSIGMAAAVAALPPASNEPPVNEDPTPGPATPAPTNRFPAPRASVDGVLEPADPYATAGPTATASLMPGTSEPPSSTETTVGQNSDGTGVTTSNQNGQTGGTGATANPDTSPSSSKLPFIAMGAVLVLGIGGLAFARSRNPKT